MYAIIQDGSRQFKVSAGDRIWVDPRDLKPGAEIVFERVLACVDEMSRRIGRPLLSGARVVGEVVRPVKAPKLIAHEYRRRKDSHVRRGHRQPYLLVKITRIEAA